MRPGLIYLALGVALIASSARRTGAQSDGVKSVHGFLAMDNTGKRATMFPADLPTVYAFWKGQALAIGDTVSVVWIAEDVGDPNRKESKIRNAEVKVYKSDEHGAFSLSRPPGQNWPVGKYRVEFYVNGGIADVLKFTVTPGATIEVQ